MHVAILGAGPIGIESALAAREMGHDVTVLEQGDVAAGVCRWGHVKMFTPWQMNTTARGRSRLRLGDLQNEGCPTGDAFAHELLKLGRAHGHLIDIRICATCAVDNLLYKQLMDVCAANKKEWIKANKKKLADDRVRARLPPGKKIGRTAYTSAVCWPAECEQECEREGRGGEPKEASGSR